MQFGSTFIRPKDRVLSQSIMSFSKGFVCLVFFPLFKQLRLPLSPYVIIVPNVGKNVGNDTFFHPLLGPVMIGHEHEILIMFLKLKLHEFKDFYSKDA